MMEEGEEFGQIPPSLSVTIKTILERYPDGQIFKEMIQNADDAGAKKIQFFVDHRQHTASTTDIPGLESVSSLLGPALLSANDAEFKEEDWKGIRRLHQSIKADDPFKVGRFGIGFNSVYHITDVAAIISGDRLAYLDPQESLWNGKSGKAFKLPNILSSNCLKPFDGIAEFDADTTQCYTKKTLFRFPLRNKPSDLSENVYTVENILKLIDALKSEAQSLLIFLRSITCIEIFEINCNEQKLLLKSSIAGSYINELNEKRETLAANIKDSHDRYSFDNPQVHGFIARFDIDICDQNGDETSAQWLVSNQVGSPIEAVRKASKGQKVFPWVGAALELNNNSNGRIFCFLPMPPELSSNLPVHINGTFGVSDDRRSLKWPGLERQNDHTAIWNMLLVNEVLPMCYGKLLIEARKYKNEQVYTYWPEVHTTQLSQWQGILKPLFNFLLEKEVIWCLTTRSWLSPKGVYFIPQSQLKEVIIKILTNTGVKIAQIPENVRKAVKLCHFRINEIKPSIVRNAMRSNALSYTNFQSSQKFEVLKYCWSDQVYNDFNQLELIPLANGSFEKFQSCHGKPNSIYLCSNDCPKYLLPNIDHRLVDVLDDKELHTGLIHIVKSNTTQLKLLEVRDVARLIDETIPTEWKNLDTVPFPIISQFPSDWFQQLWEWLHDKPLSLFENKLMMLTQSCLETFIVKLCSNQAAIYIPSNKNVNSDMLSLLNKFDVKYTLQERFPYLKHSELEHYFKIFSVSNILNAISRNRNYTTVELTQAESKSLLETIAPIKSSLSKMDLYIIERIKMFVSSNNTEGKLYSVNEVSKQSLLQKCIREPLNLVDLVDALPRGIVLFSAEFEYQNQILQKLGIPFPTNVEFLEKYIFPNIHSFDDHFFDNIMTCVLNQYYSLSRKSSTFRDSLSCLKFVKNATNDRKAPSELYDPGLKLLSQMYHGENVFPSAPFSSYVPVLKECGLRDHVSPQEILNLILSISETASAEPQLVNDVKLLRAKAIIAYIQETYIKKRKKESCVLGRSRSRIPFDKALLLLSEKRSWLPILAEAPLTYPKCLQWKGRKYTSHFISLGHNTCLSCKSKEHFMIYGSQCFFTDPLIDDDLYKLLGSPEPITYLCHHFFEVLSVKDQIEADVMLDTVSKIYDAMQRILYLGKGKCIDSIRNEKNWIFIKKENKFIDIKSVAEHDNPKFRQNTEPYLYILPDSISSYSDVFLHFGMKKTITESQIISVLETVKTQVTNNSCTSAEADVWDIIMAILNWVTNNATQVVAYKSILVPAESSSSLPILQVSDTLVYTDNDFLKDFIMSSPGSSSDLQFVHGRINPNLAKCLKVKPLSEELDVSEDTFSDAGQHEPLTVRLNNILKEYKDGVTIIKELIQNADDAKATEINICFDARNHKIDQKRLFFPGMSDSHGPALIVHNNKPFEKEDFENIQKLAAGTKAKKHLKIGKFGIGFCSVYHITDVPSFISDNKLYIFDPTLSYLRKEIKNPSQPGKKVNFLTRVIQNSAQLAPYEGLFEFNSAKKYEGTMFRFPLRNSTSELGNCYTASHVNDMFEKIMEHGDTLLLFLQNVNTIRVLRIEQGEITPTTMYEITRKKHALSLNLDQLHLAHEVIIEKHDLSTKKHQSTNWLVTSVKSRIGTNEDMVASVSCLLVNSTESGKYSVNLKLKGDTFCYLPLSQPTGLPVHVSCNFAVFSNRKGIWAAEASSDEKEVQWNINLMKEVIPEAYFCLLCCLRDMKRKNVLVNYNFYSLWPLEHHLQLKNPWIYFKDSFYKNICNKDLFYSECMSCWMNRSKCKFLLDNILRSGVELECVIKVVHYLHEPIAQLPQEYRINFCMKQGDITELNFVQIFFKNLNKLSDGDIQTHRDRVIYEMLKICAIHSGSTSSNTSSILHKCFSTTASIPCGPHGILKKCCDSIHPKAAFAELFDDSECRFPRALLIDNHITCEVLKEMGMIFDNLPWSLLLNRAQTISELYKVNKSKALKRVKLILNSLTYAKGKQPSSGLSLNSIKFLPVMRRPNDYPVNWAGDKYTLLCANEIILQGMYQAIYNPMICGSQVAFVDESDPKDGGCGHIGFTAKDILYLDASPKLSAVIAHLKVIVLYQLSNEVDKKWIAESCKMIYEFIEYKLDKSDSQKKYLADLATSQCLWNGQRFLKAEFIAKNWRFQDGPYLYSVPELIAGKKNLMKFLNIKANFSIEHAVDALKKMKQDFGQNPINPDCHLLIIDLLSPSLTSSPNLKEDLKDTTVFLPNEKLVMFKSSELAYNDAVWAPKDDKYNYVHEDIPRRIAEDLGVRLVRSKLLDLFVSDNVHFLGTTFGQRERLTQRIQNILRDYPFDITLLKELLQNSDDAKAKKMYIILDKRNHGKESLISENWQKLQGPALLIWNDSVFSEQDLKGIQELGLGSKRSESETIGQYGIGFNVVYHLTDCPSFITGKETLCIMDPHCMYADGATESSPGRRYDNITKNGFWDHFKDMSTSYLVKDIDNIPKVMKDGSLFRFPIRYSKEMVDLSKIVDRNDQSCLEPMTTSRLAKLLRDWLPDLKNAMFFLNNIDEIKYMEIEPEGRNLDLVFHYSSRIPEFTNFKKSMTNLKLTISNFKDVANSTSCIAYYPLVITEHNDEKNQEEKWFIQQGIGDVKNSKQAWQYVRTVKPRHGIAAPLDVSSKVTDQKKQVFCYLPLPIFTKLPVHINGSFILNSNRRDLWKSTSALWKDSKSQWNHNLFQALASSYAEFLCNGNNFYIQNKYLNLTTAVNDLHKYCSIFPSNTAFEIDDIRGLVNRVFEILVQQNSEILCVFLSKDKTGTDNIVSQWHPLIATDNAKQVYIWSGSENRRIIHPILEKLGMNITSTSQILRETLNSYLPKESNQIPAISPTTVFKYYTTISKYSFSQGMECTPISQTIFHDVETFIIFLKFLLGLPLLQSSEKHFESTTSTRSSGQHSQMISQFTINQDFPSSPCSHYLLLSADNNLQKFDEKSKLFNSEFCGMFPKFPNMFLHPALRELNMNPTYFICELDKENNTKYAISSIIELLKNTLPNELSSNSVISNASSIINKETLFKFWEVFSKDRVLKSYVQSIIEKVSLLLTMDDKLYSTSAKILPMHPPPKEDSRKFMKVVEVLKKLELPFLDESVVLLPVNCPHLTENADKVLSNIMQVNIKLTSVLQNDEINILIDYFAENLNVRQHISELKKIPLFEDVLGNYQSIEGLDAYIWPDSCSNGYNSWMEGYNHIVFLNSDGYWKNLGSETQLSLNSISKQKLYNDFIFKHPHFGLMNEGDRYAHLEYIKDVMFLSVDYFKDKKINRKTTEDDRRQICEAQQFYHSLVRLHCIGTANALLLPISSFCDHTKEIFQVFLDDFAILPDNFHSERWLEFFKKLNLKQNLTELEYMNFCNKTANGNVKESKRASRVLLKYLEEVGSSYDDRSLRHISHIAFVHAEAPSEVDWIVPAFAQVNQLVTLNGSAPLHLQHLLWTIKPLICIPEYSPELMKKLGVIVEPSDADILKNIKNISESYYSNEQLFLKFPNELVPDSECCNLVHIMKKNFRCFSDNVDCSELASVSCIPVHVDLNQKDGYKLALVKPECVIAQNERAKAFHPHLHCLPIELYSVSNILQTIGYHQNLGVHHMQIVLEKVFETSGTTSLLPNAKHLVCSAITTLKSLLSAHNHQNSSDNTVKDLTPLYLPDINDQLRLSTTLLYSDTSQFFGKLQFELADTPYYYFDIGTLNIFSFFTTDFCDQLPHEVRPIGLSRVCKILPNKNCKAVPSSDLAISLERSFHDGANPENLTLLISKFAGEQKLKTAIQREIKSILCESLEFVTVDNLRAQIIFKESNKVIGNLHVEYIYDHSEHHVYLDSGADREIYLVMEVTEHILEDVASYLNSPLETHEYKKILNFVCRFLKSSPVSKLKLLERFQISGTVGCNSDFAQLNKLGAEIPQILYSRLDQHHDNIYKPTEIVGYEISEDKIIVAQVGYLINPESKCGIFHRRYKIYVKEDDETGIEVSILQLYKFIDGKKQPYVTSTGIRDNAKAIAFYEGKNLLTNASQSLKLTANEKKRYICDQLKEIWKLPDELKRKALRRLYLFYHPDKNLDNVEEFGLLFMFLKAQIVHLENNEPLDDPGVDLKPSSTMHTASSTRPTWSTNFTKWDSTARMRQTYTRQSPETNSQGEPFFHPFSHTYEDIDKRNPTEGRRWIRQAEVDFQVLHACLEKAQDTKGYAHVCFLAHQVAEKALKGGVYALCGVDVRNIRTHELTGNAHALCTVKPQEAANLYMHCHPLEDYYTKTRYPDEWAGHVDIPSDHYYPDDADTACRHAGEVIRIVKSIMPEITDEWT